MSCATANGSLHDQCFDSIRLGFFVLGWDAFFFPNLTKISWSMYSVEVYHTSVVIQPNLLLWVASRLVSWHQLSSWLLCIDLLYAKNASNNQLFLGICIHIGHNLVIDIVTFGLFSFVTAKSAY